jgi:uncharacterized membrane protein
LVIILSVFFFWPLYCIFGHCIVFLAIVLNTIQQQKEKDRQ